MVKDQRWKQPTPQMQLITIRASLDGHLSNFEDGIISSYRLIMMLKEHLEQIEQLEPFLVSNNWESQP